MTLPTPPSPDQPIPKSPFYTPPTNALQSVYAPLTVGPGLVVDDATATISAIPTAGVASLLAGAGIGLSGSTGIITVSNTGVLSLVAGSGISLSASTGVITIDNVAPGVGTVTSVATGTGLTGGPITSSGTISLTNTTVTPGSYTYSSFTVDAQGRITAASSGAPAVTAVTGSAPISVTAGLTPNVSIAAATTSASGAVQLNDTTSSTSTTQALTAAQGKVLQDQINALSIATNITLAGTLDALTGNLVTVTAEGTAAGFTVGSPLPSPAAGNAEHFVIATTPAATYTPPGGSPTQVHVGDWFLSDGTAWQFLDVGYQAPYASTTVPGIVELADDTETQLGLDNSRAVTPAGLQSKVSDSVSTTSSTIVASSTAVKTAYDAAVAAQTDATQALSDAAAAQASADAAQVDATQALADAATAQSAADAAQVDATQALADAATAQASANAAQTDATQALADAAAAQATADAALPTAGGTMTGDITFSGAGNGVVFNDASTVEAISDSVSLTSSVTAASSTAAKAAYDAGVQGQTDAATAQAAADAAQATADAALPKAGGTMTGNITFSDAGEGVTFSDASSVVAISDSTTLVSSTTAASSTAVKSTKDAADAAQATANLGIANAAAAQATANAAIPCSVITSVGSIVVGNGVSSPTALPAGPNGYVLSTNNACSNGLEWVPNAPDGVQGVTGTSPIAVDNTDPVNPVVSIDAASTAAPGAVQLNDTVTSTSTTLAGTANAVKVAYDAGVQGQTDAAAARADATQALSDAAAAQTDATQALADAAAAQTDATQALADAAAAQTDATQALADAATAQATADAKVASVTVAAPLTDSGTATAPSLGISAATTVATGVVSVGSNIAVDGSGQISVASASTSGSGVVQLYDATNSTSTTLALTAAQGKNLQDQIDALALSSNITLAGTLNASTGLVDSVTAAGTAAGFVVGSALPAAASGNSDYFVIADVPAASYTPPGGSATQVHIGDWFLSSGSAWQFLDVGYQAPYATTSVAGIVELADNAETQAGTDATLAVTPASLQSKLSDSTTTTSSTTIASSTAVKSAKDAADAAQADATQALADAAAAQATANAALPKAGGTMSGNITFADVGEGVTFSDSSSVVAISDSTSTTSSTTAASSTAVKAAKDAAAAAQTAANAAQADATQALSDAAAAQTDATQALADAAAAQSTANAAVPDSAYTALGDLLAGTGTGTYSALALGTDGYVLTADSACSSGVKWAAGGSDATPLIAGVVKGCTSGTAYNTFLGSLAGGSVTSTDTYNTALGFNSLASTTGNASYNAAVGYGSMQYFCSGCFNTALGYTSGWLLENACCNTMIGAVSMNSITTGSCNISVGIQNGLDFAGTESGNVLIGNNVGFASGGYAGCNNYVIIGNGIGEERIEFNCCGAMGIAGQNFGTSGQVLTSQGSGLPPVWCAAGGGGSPATPLIEGIVYGSTNIGCSAFLGKCAGAAQGPYATYNTAVGFEALCCVNSSYNTAVGRWALKMLDTVPSGGSNTALGTFAGRANNGELGLFLGFSAGAFGCGKRNIGIGCDAVYDTGTGTGCNNIGLGNGALRNVQNGCFNIGVGEAAIANAQGAGNIGIGRSAATLLNTGSCNIAIGNCVQVASPSGSCQLAIGFACGQYWLTGDNTKAIKPGAGIIDCAGSCGTAGQVLMSNGANAVCWGTAGGGGGSDATPLIAGILKGCTENTSCNVYLGCGAGDCTTSSSIYNTGIGYGALCNVAAFGSYNTAVGMQALSDNTTGQYNTALGLWAGQQVTDGNCNTLIGKGAMGFLKNGNRNIALGFHAGWDLTTSETGNVFIGNFAGSTAPSGTYTGCDNYVILANGVGENRVEFNICGAMGLAGQNFGTAGQVLTSRGNLLPPVWCAAGGGGGSPATPTVAGIVYGCTTNTTKRNVSLGQNSMCCLTTGGYNTAIGAYSQFYNTTGCNNASLGAVSLNAANGGYNTAVGSFSMQNAIGSYNTALGLNSMIVASGSYNVALGAGATLPVTGGSCQLVIGINTGTGVRNWLTGCSDQSIRPAKGIMDCAGSTGTAGQVLQSNGANAICWGTGVVASAYTAKGTILAGSAPSTPTALSVGTNGQFLVADSACTTGLKWCTVGLAGTTSQGFVYAYSGGFNCTNSAFGYQAGGPSGNCGSCNTSIGTCAHSANTTGVANTIVGYNAGKALTTTGCNTIIGSAAAPVFTGSGIVAIGRNALGAVVSGGNSVFIGGDTAALATDVGFWNVVIGHQAACSMSGTTGRNIIIGGQAGCTVTTGANNIIMGLTAGGGLTTGSANIQIGGITSGNVNAPVYTLATTDADRIVMGSSGVTNAYIKVAWTVVSDARDKIVEGAVPHGLEFVKQLNPVAYRFKEDRNSNTPAGPKRYGFLAQNILALEGTDPVIIDAEDADQLRYNGEALVPVLVNAIQELSQQLEALREEFNDYRATHP